MMAKNILMSSKSKYLLSRNVSRKKSTKPRSSDSHQNMTVIPSTETDDEGSRPLSDF